MVGYPLELWTGQPGQRCKEVFRFMEQVYKQADILHDGTEGGKVSVYVRVFFFVVGSFDASDS